MTIVKYISLLILLFTCACTSSARFSTGTNKPLPASVNTEKYYTGQEITGKSSYYGPKFHGRKTANGETFDMYKLTAAHRNMPFGTQIQVTNLKNNKNVIVYINDRGPFIAGRILDLSYGAAKKIDMISDGVANIRIKILRVGNP
jgi:rare lipoprotein A